jgi:glucose/arabinose dehydrogenase
MDFSPTGQLWVLQQTGAVKLVRNDGTTHTALTLTVDSAGERGLLGIAFDPSYDGSGPNTDFVYLYYTRPRQNATTPANNRISRFIVSNAGSTTPTLGSESVILNLAPENEDGNLGTDGDTNHNGGAIHFGPDGKLYVAVGDHNYDTTPQVNHVSQLLTSHFGKILRLNPDGTNPTDNPFADGNPTSVRGSIWALGLRNPYTFAFQPGGTLMYINDVGEGTWEEINRGEAAANYGWAGSSSPLWEGFENDGTPPPWANYRDPVMAYDHSDASGAPAGCAITGGAFYPAGSQFGSAYAGQFFFADFCGDFIRTFNPATPGTVSNPDPSAGFASSATFGSPVDLKVDAAGSLYFLARGGGGGVFKIQFQAPTITGQPANTTVNAGQTATFTVSATGTGTLSYQWQQLLGNNWTNLTNGGRIAGATSTTLTITNTQASDAGTYRAIVRNSNGATTASNGASLTVTTGTAPSITGQPASQTINVGGTATFTVTASGAAPLAYQWQQFVSGSWTNLTNGGRIAGATSPTLTISNVATSDAGQYRVTVSNSFGTATSNAATLTVNQFPTATITAPAAGMLWTFGQTINFAGTASDPENGTLPASAFTWEVLFGHDVHTHPHLAPTTGIMSGSFVANFNETDPDVFYRIILTVRDANGAAFTTSRDIFPQKVQLTLNTVPAGLALSLDGQPVTGPSDSVVGVTRTLQAPPTQTSGGTTYNFVSWSDGGAATHTIVTPAANSTYTATYQAASNLVPGLKAEFFDYTTSLSALPDLTGRTPNVVRTDARINYPRTSSPWPGLGSNFANTFASRHTGFLRIATAGTYTLYLNSDDGSRLWLDGQLVIDNDGRHNMRERSATRNLTAGDHSLRVEFFENAGGAGLILSWAGPGISKQVIPASALFQAAPAALLGLREGRSPAPRVASIAGGDDIFWAWSDALASLGVQAGVGSEPQSTDPLDDGPWDHAALIGDVTTGAATLAAEARITPIGGGRLVGSGMYLKEVLEELGFGNELLGGVEI